jgi:hypothetical protein
MDGPSTQPDPVSTNAAMQATLVNEETPVLAEAHNDISNRNNDNQPCDDDVAGVPSSYQ